MTGAEADRDRLKRALEQAPPPEAEFFAAAYLDWFFKVRAAALIEPKRGEVVTFPSGERENG